jgi:2,4-dienoyl-CoA reductase-like NADH-dependent reductase (Old Yellow Enzyme family)
MKQVLGAVTAKMAEKSFLPFPEDWKTNPGHPVKTNKKVPLLFTPLKIRGIELKNRIMVSPMCQYSSVDGLLTEWHLVHLGGFARGGAGLICIEATGVTPNGRISAFDSGIWDDKHIAPIKKVVDFAHEHKAHVAIQLAHAGRKASTNPPFAPRGSPPGVPDEQGGWTPVAPSAIPFHESYRHPVELTKDQIKDLVKAFADAAIRADKAGVDVVELHGAHGYLIHSFLSPISNVRTDEYGGSFEGRTRFLLEVAKAVRAVWPKEKPLFVRLSCTDWVEGGWTADETAQVSKLLKDLGVDALDCSSGGGTLQAKIPVAPGYQVPFSEKVRKESGILTCAVGLLTDPHQVETILQQGQADIIAIAREFLRNASWPLDAARELGVDVEWTPQHERGKLQPKY